MAVSGLPADRFLFLGFLPRAQGERRALLRSVAAMPFTLVIFEAPHRLQRSLADIVGRSLETGRVTALREATKLHEEVFPRHVCRRLWSHFERPRGEFTLVVGWEPSEEMPSPEDAEEMLRSLLARGVSGREARALVAEETGMSRREVYRMWLRLK